MKQIKYELHAGTLTITVDAFKGDAAQTLTVTHTRQQVAFFDRVKQMQDDWNWQVDSLLADMKAMSATEGR